MQRVFLVREVEPMIAHNTGEGFYGLEEGMVSGHLAHGAKGHDVIGEEGILAGDLRARRAADCGR